MKKLGWWIFNFRTFSRGKRNKEDSNSYGGRKQGSNFSRASIHSRSEVGSIDLPGQSSLNRSLIQDFSSSFISFFIPRRKKFREGTNQKKHRSIQTDDVSCTSEFRSEIGTLSKIEHQNLVRFLGCLEDNEEQIVVTEYVENGTLREHLDGTSGHDLELAQRLDIAVDVAHAITYLHTYTDHPIIHRDIKSSNILLTENLRAKVADFGFARLAAEDPNATHVSTQVKGTAGYLDPEYIRTYQLTEKSDVYSFGVLLVELVTARHPIERGRGLNKERITTRWAMQKFRQGEVVIAMDQRLKRSPASIGAVNKVMDLACGCLASTRNSRPPMKRCAEVLWGIRRDFHTAQIAAAASQRPAR